MRPTGSFPFDPTVARGPYALRAAAALSLGLLGLAGCASPDLGLAPFYCNPPPGYPTCPDDYECDLTAKPRPVCVRAGNIFNKPDATVARPEGSVPLFDAGVDVDQSGPAPDQGPTPTGGPVLISEFMPNPQAVNDGNGEYVELFNASNVPVDVNGWTIKDAGQDTHTIDAGGSLLIGPKAYLLLGINIDKNLNGGVSIAYAYTNFFLSNTEDEVVILDDAGKVVDSFSYGKSTGFNIVDGASLSLKNPGADKNDAANWCVEQNPWAGSKGDRGTPGAGPGCL